MPELTDEELETRMSEARNEGRMEREREWQDSMTTQRITDLENRLDNLTQEVVAEPPAEIAAAAAPPQEAEAEAEPEVEHVQAPPEPPESQHHEKHKPKFRIL